MYKLIALDMDGTLLNENREISKKNLKSIRIAIENGIKVVLATGRPLKGIENFLKELDLIDNDNFSVSFNGALVQNNTTGAVLSRNILTHDDVKYLYNLSKILNVNRHALTKDSVLTTTHNPYTDIESNINGIPIYITDLNNLDPSAEIIKFMFVDDPNVLDEVIKKLPKEVYEKYTVVRSATYFLEFLHPVANKGAGVKAIAKELNIKSNEIICVGDAGNDIHMLQYAGLGVAMGNAFDEVKEIADYITKSNSEDGVAHVINEFILKNKIA
ncbi:sugar-phosphatase [Clostridium sediminicola]|uniref:sugar-phosphatase n=1 Tax=Clostridium sediminicola TaxID=3114879 RepID=UPI0031F25737